MSYLIRANGLTGIGYEYLIGFHYEIGPITLGETMTAIMKVTRRGQTTIPQELRDKYGINEGDYLVVAHERGKLILTHIPRLENLAGVDSRFGKVGAIKVEVDKMRDGY